jgi:uncharacterized RDD family membrane protein YckC
MSENRTATVELRPLARPLASFWRRLGAFAIDAALITLVFSVATMPLFGLLARLGPWGRLLGFFLALPYFAWFDSHKGGGHTPGKRWLGMQVVDARGETLSLPRTLLRYAVFSGPYFLNGAQFPMAWTAHAALPVLQCLVVLGAGGASLYLLLFDGKRRQGLHDLAAGSFVVLGGAGAPRPEKRWTGHWAFAGMIVAAALALSLHFFGFKPAPDAQMQADLAAVKALDGVMHAGLRNLHLKAAGQLPEQTILQLDLVPAEPAGDAQELAARAARAVLAADPAAAACDLIDVKITRGYDLGIAAGHVSKTLRHSPKEWLAGPKPAH